MEGESSNSGEQRQKRPRQRRASKRISYESSVANLSRAGRETLTIVSRKKPLNMIPGTFSVVYDNKCPSYSWLRCGWIVEERLLPHDRLYRYFYDPIGQMYNSRGQVDQICSDIEKNHATIIID